MINNELIDLYSLIKDLEGMKTHTRTAFTSEGKAESIAEHSWRVTMMCLLMAPSIKELDINKVLKLSLVHDLGEVYEGDISAKIITDEHRKFETEEQAIMKLTNYLPEAQAKQLSELWYEYNEAKTHEALFVKGVDKLETIIQHNQGLNPEDFDYEFNLEYGTKFTDLFKITKDFKNILKNEILEKIATKNNDPQS